MISCITTERASNRRELRAQSREQNQTGTLVVGCDGPRRLRADPDLRFSLSAHDRISSARRPRGFTLVEVMVGATLSVFLLAGILSANLQIIRGGVRITQYAEMETQLRRGLEYLGRDIRDALTFTWNGESDITLTVPTDADSTTQVTYAWSSASQSFYRVAGASSAQLAGRLELVRGIPALANGDAGLKFTRLDRDGAAATTDEKTQRLIVTMTVKRSAKTAATATARSVSASFTLRNKPDN